MSTGNEIPYRRSARGKDATGSLLLDNERKQAKAEGGPANRKTVLESRAIETARIG